MIDELWFMMFMVDISMVDGGFKPTCNWMETATKPFESFAKNGIIVWEEYHSFWPLIGNGDLKRPTPREQCVPPKSSNGPRQFW